jgi:phycocyanobilin lyase beta subunit
MTADSAETHLAKTLIQAVETADSSTRLLEAVQQLSEARLEAAIPTLIAALGYNNPGAAVAAVDGLIMLGKAAVAPLLELVDTYNYGARAWAIRALAGIGDPRGLGLLIEAAKNDFALSVRRAAARGLGTVNWEELSPEQAKSAQAEAAEVLLEVLQDPEWVVRYAAVTGLQELAIAMAVSDTDWAMRILSQFEQRIEVEDSQAVMARIWLAQKEIHEYAVSMLEKQPDQEVKTLVSALDLDWQATLDRLYARKRREEPLPEGDPRKFREAAATIYKEIA